MKKNFENFLDLLCTLKSKVHVICFMTETWLGPLDNIKDITVLVEGCHTPLFENRQQCTHGGIITYSFKFKFKIFKITMYITNEKSLSYSPMGQLKIELPGS